MFVAAFCTMVVSLLPYIVPFSITLTQAAAPHASLAFLFWGAGLFVLPLTIIYTIVIYVIFRTKKKQGVLF
jgi:cytochrome d ubiquinol oxidase subunit II